MAVVRRVEPDEWPILRAVRLEALATDPDAFESSHADEVDHPEDAWRFWTRRRAVAFTGDRPVGMVGWAFGDNDNDPLQLIGMWVTPDARGSGIAQALVDHVVGVAERKGRILELGVRADNPRALRFYENAGFTLTGNEAVGRRSRETILTMRYRPPDSTPQAP